jgi:hypothetical protein
MMKLHKTNLSGIYLLAAVLLTISMFNYGCNESGKQVGPIDSVIESVSESTAESASASDTVKLTGTTQNLLKERNNGTSANNETDEKETTAEPVNYNFPTKGVRPVAVMIDNGGTKCLPQGGLDMAQIIYEILVEGGITRLMPLFWDEYPEMVGPVRSSRHYFLDYVMEHNAIYIHFGWSPMAKRDISKYKINNANGVANGGEIFHDITKIRGNCQDSYTSMESIMGYVKKAGYKTQTEKSQVFEYNIQDVTPFEGYEAKIVNLKYSHYSCSYEYDAAKSTYKRFRNGKPHMERVSGKQLKAKNIIIQYMKNYDIKGDTEGRQELITTGSGNGYYITCGKAIKIKWSKTSRNSPTNYTNEEGKKIMLNPGQAWIQIMPLHGEVTLSD